jgi:hypothetical protein
MVVGMEGRERRRLQGRDVLTEQVKWLRFLDKYSDTEIQQDASL